MIVFMILKIFSLTSRRMLKRNLNLLLLQPPPRGADEILDQKAEAAHVAGDGADLGVVIGAGADTGEVGVEVNPMNDDTVMTVERGVATGAEREVLRDTALLTMTTTMMITTLDTRELKTGDIDY